MCYNAPTKTPRVGSVSLYILSASSASIVKAHEVKEERSRQKTRETEGRFRPAWDALSPALKHTGRDGLAEAFDSDRAGGGGGSSRTLAAGRREGGNLGWAHDAQVGLGAHGRARGRGGGSGAGSWGEARPRRVGRAWCECLGAARPVVSVRHTCRSLSSCTNANAAQRGII